MNLKPYLQLVRLPNLFTAAADSLAGFLMVRGALDRPSLWLPLCLASMAIYAAGIALNDLCDYRIDLEERPGRPLPSGRVTRRFAGGFGAIAMAMGIGLAALSSPRSAIVAGALAGCVLLYNLGLKRTPLGPIAMGSCRGLNLALGLGASADFGGPTAWVAAGSLALFVAGLTWISRSEVETGKARGVAFGMGVQLAAMLGLAFVAFRASTFPGASGDRPIVPVEGLLVLSLVLMVVSLAGGRAVVEPRPETIQKAVKTGVLSLVWLDVGLVAAVRGPGPALAVAALWVPAFLIGKWLYST